MAFEERARHVVFGAGPLGRAVADAVVAAGHEVVVASRSGGDDVVACDATQAVAVAGLCEGAAVVYNCAQPPYHRWPDEFPPIQRGVLDGAARAGVTFVAAENLYMYGPVDGPITEDLAYRAHTRKGAVRAAMAREVQQAHAAGRVRTTSGRASDFFGARVTSSFLSHRLIERAARGATAWVVGDPDAPHTYTYVRDFARALVVLGVDERALGRAWHVPSAPTPTTRAFLELVAEVAGARPARVRSTPAIALRVGAA